MSGLGTKWPERSHPRCPYLDQTPRAFCNGDWRLLQRYDQYGQMIPFSEVVSVVTTSTFS